MMHCQKHVKISDGQHVSALVKITNEAVLNVAVLCNGFRVVGNCRHIGGNLCVGVCSFSVRNIQVKPPSLLKCRVNSEITHAADIYQYIWVRASETVRKMRSSMPRAVKKTVPH
jgi:hypothetical protein